MAHHPKHTYVFDEYEKEVLEKNLDKIKLFTNIELGITMEDFVLHEKDLSHLFVPVGSFDDESQKSSNTEYVAAIEGVIYPWFGFAHRLDRVQFSIE